MLPRAIAMTLFLAGAVAPIVIPLWVIPGVLIWVAWWCRSLWLVAVFLIGIFATLLAVNSVSSHRILVSEQRSDEPILVERCWQSEWGQRCLVRAHKRTRFYVNWQASEPPKPGLRGLAQIDLTPWQATVQPGQSSFALWLLRHRVAARGSVHRFAPQPLSALAQAQYDVRSKLRSRTVSQRARGFYEALVMGDRAQLDATVRGQVARTQTQHLLALSGLHIGSLALWAYWIAGWLWQCYPKGVKQDWQKCAALIMAGLLLWVAIPAVSLWRAFLMTAIPGVAWLLRHHMSLPRLLLCIACLMVVADPLIWLDLGAWFSWWATLLLLLLVRLIKHWPSWKQLIVIQLCLSVLLMPIHALWQLPMFPSGMVLNLILIPWVTFVSLPLAFLTGMGVPGAAFLFNMAIEVWRLLLAVFDHLWLFLPSLPPWLSIITGAAAAWGLVAHWTRWQWLSWMLLTLALMGMNLQSVRYQSHEFGLWVLDVGAGQAVIIETAAGRVLIDLGVGLGHSVEVEHSILRWSLQAPWQTWHTVVLSRPGRSTQGALSTLAQLQPPPTQTFASQQPQYWPDLWPKPQFCAGDVGWQLADVHFRFIRPQPNYQPTNPHAGACVLVVESSAGRIVLLNSVTLSTVVALMQSNSLSTADVVVSQGRQSRQHERFVAALQPSVWVIQAASSIDFDVTPDAIDAVCTCGTQSWFLSLNDRGVTRRNSGLHLLTWLKLP